MNKITITTKPTSVLVNDLNTIFGQLEEELGTIRNNAQIDSIDRDITYKHARTNYETTKAINIQFLPVGLSQNGDRFGYGDIYNWSDGLTLGGQMTKEGYDFLKPYADESGNIPLAVFKNLYAAVMKAR